MVDVAQIKGRAMCLHADIRRVVTARKVTFHVDASGGGEAGAPGAKDRELAGEQLAVEQANARRSATGETSQQELKRGGGRQIRRRLTKVQWVQQNDRVSKKGV